MTILITALGAAPIMSVGQPAQAQPAPAQAQPAPAQAQPAPAQAQPAPVPTMVAPEQPGEWPGERIGLERAIVLALARNERSIIADKRARAASERVSRARAAFWPQATFAGSYTRYGQERMFQSQNDVQASLLLDVTLFDMRMFPLYRQARLDSEAADLEARDEQRLLAFDVASAYVGALGLEQVVAAAERRVQFASQNEADARGRVEAQLTSSNDLTRAELERTAAERELTRARAELETTYLQLEYLIDYRVARPLDPPAALLADAAAPPAPTETLMASARAQRLDVQAAFKRAEALYAFASEPRARVWPRLDLRGQMGLNENISGDRDPYWLVSLNLSVPLLDVERFAEEEERSSTASSVENAARAALRRVATDVRAALVALSRSQAAVQQSEAVVAAARKNADESAILYREGLARAIEVADASARLFDAEVALARERFGLALALLDLRATLGLDPLGKEMRR